MGGCGRKDGWMRVDGWIDGEWMGVDGDGWENGQVSGWMRRDGRMDEKGMRNGWVGGGG